MAPGALFPGLKCEEEEEILVFPLEANFSAASDISILTILCTVLYSQGQTYRNNRL
jgi:hypothetical protein